MKNSPYILISQYLQSEDVNNDSIPSSDRFKFFLDQQNSFFVYISLACFLSPEAKTCLYLSKTEIQIRIHNVQFDPALVIASLVGLLSGSPLLVDKLNFALFQQIFKFLGNKDFRLYFCNTPPEAPTQFFLSVNSLKGISNYNIEKKSLYINIFAEFFNSNWYFSLILVLFSYFSN
jgi:hypothetical protein